MDQILSLLQWLIPSGSLVALLTWITSRRLRGSRETKEVHDTYKAMYEDVHQSLITLSNENKEIRQALIRLESALARANTCRYRDICPIKRELRQQAQDRKHERGDHYDSPRQHRPQDRMDEPCQGACRDSSDGDTSSEPP